MTCIKDHPHQMDGRPSPEFSWWIENEFHSPSGLRFHRIIYFQVSRAVCFSHNRFFLCFLQTRQLLSASAVIYGLLPNCMTKLWKCVRVQQLGKACSQSWSVQRYHSEKSRWAQGSLTDAMHHCTTCVQDGNASSNGPIFVVCLEYFMLHICKEKSGGI